jgi:hypothetical protein
VGCIFSNEGILSFVKPHLADYGGWGHDSFIPHGLYVLGEHIERARDSIRDSEGEKL